MQRPKTVHDRLDDLYTDRADLLERIAGITRESSTPRERDRRRITEGESPMFAFFVEGTRIANSVSELRRELEWVEKQILALLSNPALIQ